MPNFISLFLKVYFRLFFLISKIEYQKSIALNKRLLNQMHIYIDDEFTCLTTLKIIFFMNLYTCVKI